MEDKTLKINPDEMEFRTGVIPNVEDIINLYDSSGINRPTADKDRIREMYSNSNLIVSAWNRGTLIGVARSLTDFCYACYLSDLAVRKEHQKEGIGKKLIELTRKEIGERVSLILLSAPTAMEYYPKVGFEKANNGFIMNRKK